MPTLDWAKCAAGMGFHLRMCLCMSVQDYGKYELPLVDTTVHALLPDAVVVN